MINDLEKRKRSVRDVDVLLIVVVLVGAAFLLGRWSDHAHRADGRTPNTFVEDPARRAVVEQQLAEAQKSKKWNDEQQGVFMRNVMSLSRTSRHDLSRELAGLINTNALIVERGSESP
jgi:hypothetical protein